MAINSLVEDMDGSPASTVLDAYQRVWWTIEGLRTCIEHSRPISSWKRGGKGLDHDFSVSVTGREYEIRQSVKSGGTRVAHAGERYLHRRLMKEPQPPIWLDTLEFAAASKAMDMFGSVETFGRNWKVREITSDQWAVAAAAGFEIVKDGPTSIRPFLERRFSDPSLTAMAGFHEIIGRQLYNWLVYKVDSTTSDLEPLRTIVRDFILESAPVDTRVPLIGAMVEKSRVHSIFTAAAGSRLHQATVKKVLIGAGIVLPDDGRPEARITFPAEPAESLLKDFSEGIPQKGVEKYLDCTLPLREALVAAGHLSPVARAPGLKPVYHPRELDTFCSRLSFGATLVDAAKPGQFTVIQAAKRARCFNMDVIDLLLNRRLKWVGLLKGKKGIGAILVSLEEVREATKVQLPGIKVEEWRKEFGINIGSGATLRAVLHKLGAKPQLLKATRVDTESHVVTWEDRARIASKFVSLRDLSNARAEVARRTRAALSKQGVDPIELNERGVIVYRRADLT